MPFQFEELEGSPRISIEENGQMAAERVFKLAAWADWPEFVEELRGVSHRVGATGVIRKPKAHFPGISLLRVSRVHVEPFDATPDGNTTLADVSHGLNTYSGGAKVRVEYRVPDTDDPHKPQAESGTFLTWEQDLGTEVLAVPGRYWKWTGAVTDRLPEDAPLGITVPIAVHSLTWTNVASPPVTAIRELRGRINSAAFLGAPTGCVLFSGARITKTVQTDGDTKYALQYTFHEKTVAKVASPSTVVGHNWFFHPEGSGGEHWFEIVNNASGAQPYQAGDLTRLFRYEG